MSRHSPASHGPTADEVLLLRAACAPAREAGKAWREWRLGHSPGLASPTSARLLPWIYHRREELEVAGGDLPVLLALYHLLEARNQRLLDRVQSLLDVLTKGGIEPMFVKGLPMLCGVYPDRGLCFLSDVDLMLRREEVGRAVEALLAAGWRWSGPAPERRGRLLMDMWKFDPWCHHHALVSPDGLSCDLHWDLLRYPMQPVDEEPTWQSRSAFIVESRTAWMPAAEDLLLQILSRGFTWEKFSRSLRWIVDVRVLLGQGRIDWDRFLVEARRRKCVLLVLRAAEQVEAIAPGQFPARVLACLAAEWVGWRERAVYRFLTRDNRGASWQEMAYGHWLRVERSFYFVTSRQTWWELLRSCPSSLFGRLVLRRRRVKETRS